MRVSSTLSVFALAVGLQSAAAVADDERDQRKGRTADKARAHKAAKQTTVQKSTIDKIVAKWPAKPKAVAYQMIKKYGPPNLAGSEMLVWHDNGPWKRTTVFRDEVPHHFPKVHTDLLEQVIELDVPADKLDELGKFDAAISYHGTSGELAARCDMEAANFLALNLAHDVIDGKKSVEQARAEYGRSIVAMLTGEEMPKIMKGLAFEPAKNAGNAERGTLDGVPQPAAKGDSPDRLSDPEVLAALITGNAGEVQLASFVLENSKNERVRAYAAKLKNEHGKGLKKATQLAKQANITPIAGGPVPEMQERGAENMAKLAQQQGAAFDRTFLAISIQGHKHKLQMIEQKLLPAANNPQLVAALKQAHATIAQHLEQAQQLAGGNQVSKR